MDILDMHLSNADTKWHPIFLTAIKPVAILSET